MADMAEARRKRAEQKRRERARMTPEERAARRYQADADYRDSHREQRRVGGRTLYRRLADADRALKTSILLEGESMYIWPTFHRDGKVSVHGDVVGTKTVTGRSASGAYGIYNFHCECGHQITRVVSASDLRTSIRAHLATQEHLKAVSS